MVILTCQMDIDNLTYLHFHYIWILSNCVSEMLCKINWKKFRIICLHDYIIIVSMVLFLFGKGLF